MEEYFNKNIKDVIRDFPEIADILNEHNIGCTSCNAGTCLMKDIVEIHNLPEEERELMVKLAKILYPDREVEIPRLRKKAEAESREIKYSPPMKKLVLEHELIKRWVALIPKVVEHLDRESEEGGIIIRDGMAFVRNYADKYHHAKEEEILFKYFGEDLDIIKTMHVDHECARAHVRDILGALEEGDMEKITEHLTAYRELLMEHIKKEDEILYPWMDRSFSTTQVGELFSKFNDVDEKFGDAPQKYEEFINKLEQKLKFKKVGK